MLELNGHYRGFFQPLDGTCCSCPQEDRGNTNQTIYQELNKKTIKDPYPLPWSDEVQDKLEGSTMFSTLDLHYLQLLVHSADRPKTAFRPGPGMGLFQFTYLTSL